MEPLDALLTRYTPLGLLSDRGVLCFRPAVALELLQALSQINVGVRAVLGWYFVDEDHGVIDGDIRNFLDIGCEFGATYTIQISIQRAKTFINEELFPTTDLVSLHLLVGYDPDSAKNVTMV